MKNFKRICSLVVLLALTANDAVWARGGHGHKHSHFNLGISVGGGYYPGFYGSGFYGPGFYGYRSYGYPDPFFSRPYYRHPPTVVVPVTPPVYIQQEQVRPVRQQTNYWHYCQNPEGYYPYVKNCPGGWLQVASQPPAP